MKSYLIFLTILTLLFFSGCLPQPGGIQEEEGTPPVEIPPIPVLPTVNSPEAQTMIDLAKNDLAQRLDIPADQIEVGILTEVTWRDGSLGCPEPGAIYTQAEVDGYLIFFDANGRAFEYHTNKRNQVVYCENPELPVIPLTPGEIKDGQPWMPVNPIQPGEFTPSK